MNEKIGSAVLSIASKLLYIDALRVPLLRAIAVLLRSDLIEESPVSPAWQTIRHQRKLIYVAVIHTIDRILQRRLVSRHVMRVIIELWGRALFSSERRRAVVNAFRDRHGCDPPWFLVVSPNGSCNLHCEGCYADSGPAAGMLDWHTFDRIMSEAKELWGVPLFVFSGGEPLIYQSRGKDILDAVEKHSDCLFLIFTNGTLINQDLVTRMVRLGNITPALSVEGMRDETDARRGSGVFDQVLAAMATLRRAGVPFGISVTATRNNCDHVLSDEFLNFFFDEQGAFYLFVFQYLPIGRDGRPELMPTPEQWIRFRERSWQVITSRRIFLLDFWNHGPLVEGCISSGRERGYMYIDWNGKVMPCVFVPYSTANINQIHAQGGTLDDVWDTPFFKTIRQWQREYGYGKHEPTRESNWLSPCPFRDHYDWFRQIVEYSHPDPEDESAREALTNQAYHNGMVTHGSRHAKLSETIWEREYLRRKQ